MTGQPATADVEVVVVGLGPVGLLLALLLGEAGRRVLAVDRAPEPYPLPRAVATDDEVLRILRALPDGQAVLDAMLLDCPVELVGADGRPVVGIRFLASGPGLPGLATFHQPTLERQLNARLSRLDTVECRRGVEVRSVTPVREAVRVEFDVGRPVTSRFVVGCDGATSTVRRSVGIELRGRRFREPWLVVDTVVPEGDAEPPPPTVQFTCNPRRPAVSIPMPGGRRWEVRLEPDEVAGATEPDRTRMLLAEAGAPADAEVVRRAVYTFSASIARRWRTGRILLAGDAVHLMPPFVGQGLSAGLRDASALSWRLDLLLHGLVDDEVLDDYQRERVPHVRAMTALARFLGAVVQTRRTPVARVRDGLLRAAGRSPVVGPWLAAGGPRAAPRLPRWGRLDGAGRLLPAVDVRGPDGPTVPLDRLLAGRHALVGRADPFQPLSPAARRHWQRIGVRRVVWAESGERPGVGADVIPVAGGDPALHRLLSGNRVLVVRPDRYVVAAVPPDQLEQATGWYLGLLRYRER